MSSLQKRRGLKTRDYTIRRLVKSARGSRRSSACETLLAEQVMGGVFRP